LSRSLTMLFFRTWRKSAGQQLLVFWDGFIIPVVPEVIYIWQHLDDFLARMLFQNNLCGHTWKSVTRQSLES